MVVTPQPVTTQHKKTSPRLQRISNSRPFHSVFQGRCFLLSPWYFFLTPRYFSLSAQKKFVTNLLTCITKFVICVTKFLTCVTNFVTKTFLYDRKNYLADSENYLADNKNYLADSGTWNLPHTRVQNKMFVERRSTWPENSQPISGQDKDKTNPSLMTGLRRKPYTRNQI